MRTTLLFLALVLSFASCDPGNGVSSGTGQIASSGTWRVTLFTDSGNDETSDFAGYTFTFSNSGTVTAQKNSTSQTGTWSINSSSNKFNIDLGAKTDANKPLGELTDDWLILSVSNTEIRLGDDNPASNEFLTFTKN
ncbi:MAG: hypothetical protein JNK14_12515 [Chitinophagaceae bacterium]|nr:hypothetical protein [Chitinophagaceae bacterium]